MFACVCFLWHLSGCEQRLVDLFLQLSVIIQLSFLQRVQPALLIIHRASQQRVRVQVRHRRRVQVTVFIWALPTKTHPCTLTPALNHWNMCFCYIQMVQSPSQALYCSMGTPSDGTSSSESSSSWSSSSSLSTFRGDTERRESGITVNVGTLKQELHYTHYRDESPHAGSEHTHVSIFRLEHAFQTIHPKTNTVITYFAVLFQTVLMFNWSVKGECPFCSSFYNMCVIYFLGEL